MESRVRPAASACPFLGRLSGDPGGTGLPNSVCWCFQSKAYLEVEGFLITVSEVRSSPVPAADQSWGLGRSSEFKVACLPEPASRGGLCPSLSMTRFEHFSSVNLERDGNAGLTFVPLPCWLPGPRLAYGGCFWARGICTG